MARCVKGMHLEIGWQLKPLWCHCAILLPLLLTLLPLFYHCVVCTPVPSYHSKPTVYTCVTTVETTNDDEALYHASLLRLETINQGGNCCTFGSFVKCLLFILHLSKSQALSFEGYNYLVIHNGLELCQKDMCFWASFFGLRNQKAERVFFAPSCVENVSVSLFFHDTFLHFAISLPPLHV